MNLYVLWQAMAAMVGQQFDDDTLWEFANWANAFGRPVHVFQDLVDALALLGGDFLANTDLEGLRQLYHQTLTNKQLLKEIEDGVAVA